VNRVYIKPVPHFPAQGWNGASPHRSGSKVAAAAAIFRQLLTPIPEGLRGKRNRALTPVAFDGALQRSELAAIRADRLEKTDRGLRLAIPETKQGIENRSRHRPLPYGQTELCPMRALTVWLAAAPAILILIFVGWQGPLFHLQWHGGRCQAR
jgi:hypothetical protein